MIGLISGENVTNTGLIMGRTSKRVITKSPSDGVALGAFRIPHLNQFNYSPTEHPSTQQGNKERQYQVYIPKDTQNKQRRPSQQTSNNRDSYSNSPRHTNSNIVLLIDQSLKGDVEKQIATNGWGYLNFSHFLSQSFQSLTACHAANPSPIRGIAFPPIRTATPARFAVVPPSL